MLCFEIARDEASMFYKAAGTFGGEERGRRGLFAAFSPRRRCSQSQHRRVLLGFISFQTVFSGPNYAPALQQPGQGMQSLSSLMSTTSRDASAVRHYGSAPEGSKKPSCKQERDLITGSMPSPVASN